MATLLIVDDHAVNREYLTALLGYQGHRLLEASDGAEALAVALAERPDLVIADILMPTMDGYEFVRRLRALPELADTAVIFYTAHYHGPAAETLAAECGVRHVLTKPSEPEVILQTVAQALGERAAIEPVRTEHFDRAHLQLVSDTLSGNVEELRRTSDRLAALIEVNLQLASEKEPRQLLERVCHAARALIGARYARLAVGGNDGSGELTSFASGVDSAAQLATPALHNELVDPVMEIRQPLRETTSGARAIALGLPADAGSTCAVLVAPIMSLTRTFGWIALVDKLGADGFVDEDERLLSILGAQVGRTYENGSLYAELRISEQRFRTIFENSVLGVFAVDSGDRITSANPALFRMLGYELSDGVGLDVARVAKEVYVDRRDQARFRALLVERKTLENFETRWRRKDGTVIWVSLSAALIGPRNDSDISHIGMALDITERIKLGNALSEREAGLRHAESMAKLSHVVTNQDGSFATWSDTLPLLAGLEPEAMPRTTREWTRIVHPDDREFFTATALDAATTCQRREVQYRINRPDGTSIHVRQTMEPLDGSAVDGIHRWFNTLQDVTDQKGAEQRIQRLNRVYAVLSAINSAIVRLRDRQQLFDEACRVAVVEGAFNLAWIAEIDSDLDGSVVAAYGQRRALVDGIRFSAAADAAEHDWPVSRVVREMTPVACNDVESDRAFAAFRDRVPVGGSRSVAMFPLIVGGRCEAVLTLHAREPDYFDDLELKLLYELANDVAFGLEYIAKEAMIDHLAYYDALTGLPNSTLFRDRLAQAIESSAHGDRSVALYMLDLDRFTHVNDTLGRHAGDALLRLVAERLTGVLPKPASLARISADTFAVAVPDLRPGADNSIAILEGQLFASMRQGFKLGDRELRVSARAGIAIAPGDGQDAETLFKNAEAALQQAKESDERYLFYAPAMNTRMAERVALENQMRAALEADEFLLHYQPIVDLSSGRIIGAEALIRWRHPDLGLLAPGRFLPIAETTDIILPIGRWALRTACAQAKAWHDAGAPTMRMSVNLSARQFRDEKLVQTVASALADAELDASALELELTENIVMQDANLFIDKLNALKELGVMLSLDDFGTGYSSLSYLKRMPLDQLKIDQSFIRDVISSPDDDAIVRAIISVGHALGLDIVAEGVETPAQVAWLERHRCEKIQGFHFSPPVTAAEFDAMLREGKRLPSPLGTVQDQAKTLLVVDDEANVVSAVVRLLRREGYRILTASSPAQAFELLAANDVHVILSDHRMPVMTGAEFLGKVKTMYPDTVRLLFSGHVEIDALTDAVNRGAVYRFLLKPWDDAALRDSIREAFHYYWLTHRSGEPDPTRSAPDSAGRAQEASAR